MIEDGKKVFVPVPVSDDDDKDKISASDHTEIDEKRRPK